MIRGFNTPETTPSSIPTTPATAPGKLADRTISESHLAHLSSETVRIEMEGAALLSAVGPPAERPTAKVSETLSISGVTRPVMRLSQHGFATVNLGMPIQTLRIEMGKRCRECARHDSQSGTSRRQPSYQRMTNTETAALAAISPAFEEKRWSRTPGTCDAMTTASAPQSSIASSRALVSSVAGS